jgi:hypothetical protein
MLKAYSTAQSNPKRVSHDLSKYSSIDSVHPPTHYVISKAILRLAKTSKSSISMALEQGTVIVYCAGEEGGELHISTNFLEEDLVLDGSGKALNS